MGTFTKYWELCDEKAALIRRRDMIGNRKRDKIGKILANRHVEQLEKMCDLELQRCTAPDQMKAAYDKTANELCSNWEKLPPASVAFWD